MTLLRPLGGFAAGLLALLLWVPVGLAQDRGSNATPTAAVGDMLRVDVEGRADVSGDFAVDKSGNITLPSVGRVSAAGRTTTEIGTDVARRMSLITSKIVQVTVTISQIASRRNYVLGAVLLPGMYVFKDYPTVWEAIAEAGGPTDDADLRAVEILSESQPKPTVVDVTAGAAGDITKLPRLKAGDTVRVPRQGAATATLGGESVIYVFGAVGFQGPLPLSATPDLVSAFVRCGPSQSVDFKNVEIVRKNGPQIIRMRISMHEYFDKGDVVGNPLLQAGDTIHFKAKPSAFSPLRLVTAIGTVVGVTASILYLGNR